ncbi:NAD(P)-dependent oxidoreductase [Cephaloticoccus capnophilus]|nr:NAD(P)-dependent oxidoreductase [Cephaloticoccus capnophilus]
MSEKSEKIALVGVGRMGGNMARRLVDCGYAVTAVYDAHSENATALAKEIGAKHAETLAEVTAAADIIFTVVTDDAAQLSLFDEAGNNTDTLLTSAQGKLFINCATISPKTHVEVERRAQAAGAATLEACMASSIPQARQGTLYLMCAGAETDFARAEPILKTLSSSLRYIGRTGQAAQVKALVNMVMNINTAGLAEGLGLGEALGLDLDMLREVFSQTGAASHVLKTDGEDMQRRDHECYFSAAHAAKDSGIAWTLGVEAGLPLPLASAAKQQYERLVARGLGGLDKSGVAEITFKGRSL